MSRESAGNLLLKRPLQEEVFEAEHSQGEREWTPVGRHPKIPGRFLPNWPLFIASNGISCPEILRAFPKGKGARSPFFREHCTFCSGGDLLRCQRIGGGVGRNEY